MLFQGTVRQWLRVPRKELFRCARDREGPVATRSFVASEDTTRELDVSWIGRALPKRTYRESVSPIQKGSFDTKVRVFCCRVNVACQTHTWTHTHTKTHTQRHTQTHTTHTTEKLRNATVRPGEPPRPSRGRPRKDGSPAQARTTTSGLDATQDDPMPGSSDDHL